MLKGDLILTLRCRSLQALYNAGKERDIVNIKNGDALLFAITCGQVLYGYTVRKAGNMRFQSEELSLLMGYSIVDESTIIAP